MKLFCTLLILVFTYTIATAQVAIIDSKKIIASLPMMTTADSLVKQEAGKYQQEYNQKAARLNVLVQKADSLGKISATDSLALKYVATAQQEYTALQSWQKEANEKLESYRKVLLTPYFEKINNAIKAVAQRLKYKQVMDIQTVPLAWYDKTTDITEAVIKELQ